jgi:calcium-dependent protein kinase
MESSIVIKKQTFIAKNESKLEDIYKLGKKKLGSGAFGVVIKCRHRVSKQDRACKTIAKKKVKNVAQFQSEIAILQELDHPHILKLYEYFEDDNNYHVITELCTGGEMFDKIIEKEFYTEVEAASVFKQFMLGINYCHSKGIVHRDLKPENFLYETKEPDSDIKIIDFGLSKIFRPGQGGINKMTTKAGTPYYISPEVLNGSYDEKCDIWAAGCILYTLLCGYPAFCGDDDQEILQLVVKGKFDFDGEEWEDISKEAKDLIKKMISKPERRLSA